MNRQKNGQKTGSLYNNMLKACMKKTAEMEQDILLLIPHCINVSRLKKKTTFHRKDLHYGNYVNHNPR